MSLDRSSTWRVRVTDSGLVCALGLDALSACAAADAGLSRPGPLRSVNAAMDATLGGEALVGHALPCGRADGLVGFAKALMLGRLALSDLAQRQPELPRDGAAALYLALSDRHLQERAAQSPDAPERDDDVASGADQPAARWAVQAARLAACLSSEPAAQHLGISACRTSFGGHTAIARAFDDAARHLASGRISRAYVAAIDCLIEPHELQAAATLHKLKTSERAVGFMPGEAAVCLVIEGLTTEPPAAAEIVVAGLGERRCKHDAPAHVSGRMLAEAMHDAAMAWASPPPMGGWDLTGDLNGDPARAEEWGHCAVAWQSARLGKLGVPEWIAAAVGECGTATPAMQIALLLHRARRERRSIRPTLMPLSSDNGDKVALVVH